MYSRGLTQPWAAPKKVLLRARQLHALADMSATWQQEVVFVLARLVEAAGAVVIFAGAVIGFARFITRGARLRSADALTAVRLDLGRFLMLGLEFQLASDLLRTTVAPSFEEIGRLAAVAAIRTALNYFLRREIAEERRELQH